MRVTILISTKEGIWQSFILFLSQSLFFFRSSSSGFLLVILLIIARTPLFLCVSSVVSFCQRYMISVIRIINLSSDLSRPAPCSELLVSGKGLFSPLLPKNNCTWITRRKILITILIETGRNVSWLFGVRQSLWQSLRARICDLCTERRRLSIIEMYREDMVDELMKTGLANFDCSRGFWLSFHQTINTSTFTNVKPLQQQMISTLFKIDIAIFQIATDTWILAQSSLPQCTERQLQSLSSSYSLKTC